MATSSYYNDYYNGDYDYYDSTSLQPSEFETRMTKFVRYIAKGNCIDDMEISLLLKKILQTKCYSTHACNLIH